MINHWVLRISIFILLILFSFESAVYGQYNLDSLKQNKYIKLLLEPRQDTTYIKKYNEKLSIGPLYTFKTFDFIISDRWELGSQIHFLPNVNNRLGVKLRYKGLGMGITFQLPSNEFIYGKTRSINLMLSSQISYKNIGTDIFYIRNKGHYLANADNIVPSWKSGSPYPIEPSLAVTNLGISSYAVLSDRLSIKASIHQNEKQLKSAGGLGLGGSILYSHFRADSSIIPRNQLKFYSDIDSLVSAGILSIIASPGYAYTYVYQDIFVTAMVLLGAGVQVKTYRNSGFDGGLSMGVGLLMNLNYRISAGYNGDKFYGSLNYHLINNKGIIKDSKLTYFQKGININVGMRFN